MTDESLRVLQVVASTDRRGAEVFAVELGVALEARGASVQTVALAQGAVGGLHLAVLGSRPLAASTLRALRRRAKSYDVVVAHGSTTLPACAISLVASGVPFVYRNIGDPGYWSATTARRLRVRIGLRAAAYVVAVAEPAKEILVRSYGVSRDRCSAVPTAADPDWFVPASTADRAAARHELGLADDATIVASVGALRAEKNVAAAIAAMEVVADAQLVVAGDGRERAQLEARALEVARDRVHFVGDLADPRVAYAAADVVVLTSRTEGLPGVLIEAGLSGLPAVTTDVGFVREIVRDGETGVVVPVDDPEGIATGINRALANRQVWGTAARDHCAARFNLEAIAVDWNEILRNYQ